MAEKGEGLTTTSTQILAEEVHTCRAQAVVPTSGLLIYGTKSGVWSTPGELNGIQVCLIWVFREGVLVVLGLDLPMSRQES